ncbi:ABC transporter ATP-binding protein [Pseudoroseicyclus tamaricis]|uniref:ABC transporter ATP-binding protein n=1 Tax=Pseudoroseicyclus tamaricis TaxID=2705421 RepID=A0A6B2JXW6_9RHOB|nr:ABC transporter ATP-binding protein [Pseudoroseicyclus tamaricis]NDV00202.1 ABC transporter ATP-binding protein [Pseudoroseicyclus tamaricis]
MSEAVLNVEDLALSYPGGVQALRGVSLQVRPGEVLGIAGESGCGKSTLASAMISLLSSGAEITGGAVYLRGENLMALSERDRRRLRGREIAMVFQDPLTAFNPVLRIGEQLVDFQVNAEGSSREKRRRAAAMLSKVGLEPDLALSRFPHELSGGMRQRAAIAAALLMRPAVLIADEPTTALDVTMEAQIIHLLRELQAEVGCAIVIVTHHLGVIAELCDRVAVMYAGEVVEVAPVDDLYHDPLHPYTRALLSCDPSALVEHTGHLPTIGGRLPDLADPPPGCAFAPRCPLASESCATPPPRVRPAPAREVLCHKVAP